jgi:hypothetical protein
MQIETILDDPVTSLLISTPGKVKDIVIGVPHHAPLGVYELPCDEHPEADENTGFLGYYLSRLLDCPSVIACNYFLDSNKDIESDYIKRIQSLKPKILTEIHGHGGKSAKFDIEISSGKLENNYWSKEFADRLNERLVTSPILQNYKLSGDFNAIYFKATKSLSIVENQWIAFHIELPKSIRASRSRYTRLSELLAEVLREILSEFDEVE